VSTALPAIGDLIAGRYKVLDRIGIGGMGAVFRTEQVGLGRDVAVKIILPEKASSERARKRFLREARVTASVKHAGVVQILEYGDEGGLLYIAMELLTGPTLRDLVDFDKPPLKQPRAISIALEIAEILDATARLPLVHRDLKPENILFDTNVSGVERIVLVDFGLAFATEGDATTGRLTQEGVLSGTPDYMSPEQCRADVVGPPCDVYALGCILYEMLTSQGPFRGEPAVLLSRHLFAPAKSIRAAYPDIEVHGSLDDLLMEMLDKNPATRPTASSVVDRLRRLDARAPERMSGRSESAESHGRTSRMVSSPSVHPAPVSPLMTLGRLLWVGPLDDAQHLALSVAGVQVQIVEEGSPDLQNSLDAVFLMSPTVDLVAALCANHPVIVAVSSSDIGELSQMLRAGASEAVPSGSDVIDIVRKVTRVLRRRRRK
jgi:serine/threonine protein kinase